MSNPFSARDTFDTGTGQAGIYRLSALEDAGLTTVASLPYSIRILLESVLRSCDGFQISEDDVRRAAAWKPVDPERSEIPWKPTRVIMQDFTGVPAVVDLAAMRSAMDRLGGDPRKVNPLCPVDLVIDHSAQVDCWATDDALERNLDIEFQRNAERYRLLRWAGRTLDNFRIVPPSVGIIHQINLEMLAGCVFLREDEQGPVAVPDSLVGTDSHTTMINGLGVLGWGVGGIEAEAVMLGQPLYMLAPDVIGVELTGSPKPGITATDIVLTIVEMLRAEGVVGKFVEYFGPAAAAMPVADRAVIANMGPEYGATTGFFPIDELTLDFLRETGRTDQQIQLVERYTKEQQIFRTADAPTPDYTKVLSLDLGSVEPSLAGPKRPQDRIALSDMKEKFRETLSAPVQSRGFALEDSQLEAKATLPDGSEIGHGAVVIASITSCTNTSNPALMLAAGLLAKKAVERGLNVPSHVKTSLAPGSRVVTDYLDRAELSQPLNKLGFQTVGYGCMTCIGNSGPLPKELGDAITGADLVASAVVSANRNFEGRVHALVKANYLASPPLVVAYALSGTTDFDFATQPLGTDANGEPVMLADIWPTGEEIEALAATALSPEMFTRWYSDLEAICPPWAGIDVASGELFPWDDDSTYIQEPPFMVDLPDQPLPIEPLAGARCLAALGDSVTTDHISPAGAIAPDGPAGRYLQDHGVAIDDFNSFGSRRGNDRVMTRGTLANIRIRNQIAPGTEGGMTRLLPDGETMSIYDAAVEYKNRNVPLIILAGKEYGTGSSRDWAAKGTNLLGVRAVIAASFERIHRSNLVGMGVLPLQLIGDDVTWQSLGMTGEETFDIPALDDNLQPGQTLEVVATAADGNVTRINVQVRIDTPVELFYYRNGGILPAVLRKLAD